MRNYKLGLSIHPWWIDGDLARLETELCTIEAAGAEYCELVLHGLDAVVGGRIIPVRLNRVKQILSAHALRYTLHLPYELNLLDPDAGGLYESLFRAGIEFARETGCEVIVYHAGCAQGDPEALAGREAEILGRLLEGTGGLPVCMENAPFLEPGFHSAGETARAMAAFCRRIGRPDFRLTFDVGHNFIANRGDPEKLLTDLDLLLPCIGHMHLHDNFGIPLKMEHADYSHRIACGAADLHLPPGWGRIPVDAVLERLRAYRGVLILEIEKRFEDQYAACIRSVLDERESG